MITGPYEEIDPPRANIDAINGPLLLVFGNNGCSICRGTQPLMVEAVGDERWLQQMKVQDGRGHKLGRMFGVKLWPTLVFLQDGKEVTRLVRPESVAAIREALAQLKPV